MPLEKSQILKELTIILSDILNISKKIHFKTKIKDINKWDSLNNIKILIACEKKFKIKFNTSDVIEYELIEQLVEKINSYQN